MTDSCDRIRTLKAGIAAERSVAEPTDADPAGAFPGNAGGAAILRRALRGGAMLSALLVAACAINPVSGKRELALVSESQEIEMGRQGAAQVAQTIGLYPDAAVQAWVSRLGLALAARTERPDLPWEFHVLDDPSVNAFALPGGFIFVTRGLLTHMTNEAELASVLGHESGHVAARHSVQQISRSELAQFGLGLGSVLSSSIRDYSAVAGVGLELMFLKFSRDDETQADQLGFGYALADGYDMREMVSVFRMLEAQSDLSGGGSLPQWQSTHPDPGNRIEATEERLAATTANLSTLKVGEAGFLEMIDGMVYGENPRQGFFRGSLFLHPDLKFRLQFPNGWQTQNTNTAVMAMSSAQDALIQLQVAQGTVAAASQAFFSQQGLVAGSISQTSIHGFSARTGEFSAQTSQGATLRGTATFIDFGGTTFQLLAYTVSDKFNTYSPAFRTSVTSFDRLTSAADLAVQPMRIGLTRATRAMTLEQFNSQYPSGVSLAEVALINGIATTDPIRSGQVVKRVLGSPAR